MTPELEARFKEVGSQEGVEDPIVVAKYFNPSGIGDWFATEYDPVEKIFFGYVSLFNTPHENEWGYFSLAELEEVKGAFGLGIERDLHIDEMPISEMKAKKGIV